MGKTALLLEFAERASGLGFIAAKATVGESLLEELLETVQTNGMRRLPKGNPLKGFSVGALGFSVGLTFNDVTQNSYGFRTKLSLLCDALARHELGVLLLVDEVTTTSIELRQLATAYQELVGEGKNIAIAMAGLPTATAKVLNDKTLTFLNRASKCQLGPLPIAEVVSYYYKTFKALRKTISTEDMQRAAEATHGYPYLLQLVGYHLLDLVGDDDTIPSAAVTLAIENARRTMVETVFEPSLSPLSAADVNFLKAMSPDDQASRISDVQRRLGVSPEAAQQTRARLIAAGAVASPSRGRLVMELPFLAEYLRGSL
jgi:hypothetical protein